MSGWNEIECGFNPEDQTLNFSTRCFGGDTNLYEACTLASIRSSNVLNQEADVAIECSIRSNKLFYTIDKTLGVFTDLNCNEIYLNIIFEESIDLLHLTDSAKYALVGLHDGSIQLLDIEEKECLLESKISDKLENEKIFVGGYLLFSNDNEIVFIIITTTGDIYRVDIRNPQEKCLFQKELIAQTHGTIKNVCFNYPYIFLNGSKMVVYNVESGEQIEECPLDVINAVALDTDMFLVLDTTQNLIQICARTLIRFVIGKVPFRNIIFLQNRKDIKDECLFVALTNKDESNAIYLQSFESWRDFENCTFSIKLTDEAHLLIPEYIHNDYVYITAIKDNNVTVEFRIHTVCETNVDKRLERLLKRHKFDEAEKFAQAFNLDRTQISKERAKALMIKMNCNSEDIYNWLKILDGIEDIEFKLQCCYDMHQLCDDINNVWTVLQYAFHHVKDNSDNTKIAGMAKKVTDVLNKVNTFMLIQRYNTNLVWDDFTQYNMIELVNDHLQKRNIEVATIIYNRIDMKVTLPDIEKTLNILDALPLTLHKPFLYSFIPISVNHLPSLVIVFVKWFKQKVYNMKEADFTEYPQDAITFIDDVIQLIVHSGVQIENSLYREALKDLGMLAKALNRSTFILTNYKISIPLKEYVKGSKPLIHTLLSVRLSNESFNMFFDDFLHNFMLEHNFHPDHVLLEEIENLICYEECYWVDSVLRYLQKINLIEKKLQAIYKIALSAKVPWSPSVRDITTSALHYEHPLVVSIVEEIENEPRKAVLTKYNLHRYINISNLQFFINHIMYCNLETMIEDVLTISRTLKEKQHAYRMLIHNLIGKKKFEDAFKVLHMIPLEQLFILCQDVIRTITINSKGLFGTIKNYSTIIPHIRRYYNKSGYKHIYNDCLDDGFLAIISYFNLKEIHNEIILDDLVDRKKRLVLYNVLVDKAIDDFQSNSNINILDEWINRVSKCLNVPKNDVMLKIIEKCNDSHVIEKFAQHYYLFENDPEMLCKMAALIIGSGLPSVGNETLADVTCLDLTISDSNQTSDVSILISNVRLAHQLACKATLMFGADRYKSIEYLHTLKNFFGIITEKCSTRKNIFKNTHSFANSLGNTTPSLRTFHTIKEILSIYVACTDIYNIPNTKYLNYFHSTDINFTEVNNQQILTQIRAAFQHLLREGHVLAAYHLILFLLMHFSMGTQTDKNIISLLREILRRQCIPQLLERLFASNVIDYQFAFSLLISIDLQQLLGLIKQSITLYKANPVKLMSIMQLVMKVFKHFNIAPAECYTQLLLRSKWWLKIDNCQIRMKTFYTSTTMELLNLLFRQDHLKLEVMEEFCNDFNLDIQLCYNIYLEKLITTWKPNYEINEKGGGKSKLVIKSTEDELYERCEKVLKLIRCKDTVWKRIEKFSSSINFYYYEAFLCVLKILASLTDTTCYINKQKLLNFLKMYSRVSTPSNLELEEWFAVFPGSSAIDPLSKWRLPFSQMYFTDAVWKILRPEINLKTYTIWFKAIPFLHESLNIDDICSFVVKDVVLSGVLQTRSSDGWVLAPIHESLFEEIDRCVQHISDIEKATSAINHLMIHTPEGADQLNASVLCLKYAEKYKQLQTVNDVGVEDAYIKIHNKYLKFSVSHILHLCKLNSEDYGEVLLQPNELIDTLYMHNDITKSADAVILSCSDVNKAVDDIAKLYNIDVLQKRKDLLETFLITYNTPHLDLYGSLTEDTESINLKRAAYICHSGDLVYWQKHLVTMGIEDLNLSIRGRANALKCFTMISDVDSIEIYVDLQYNAFLNYIDKLYLLSDLESRGFSMTIEQLNDYNKKVLLRLLAKDMYNPTTIKIMADICMVYSICDTKYWNKIVEMSIKLDLCAYLKKYINFWSTHLESKYKNFYIDTWQYMMDKSFTEITSNKELEIFNLCVKNLLMIQACPIVYFLSFDKVFDKLCQMDRYDFAAVIIQYMPNEKQDEFITDILNHTNEVPDLSALEKRGVCGISMVNGMFRS